MAKYRKKPVVIEARQLKTETVYDILRWIQQSGGEASPITFGGTPGVSLNIETLEGTHTAKAGDFIIQGVNNEFYPCKEDIFWKTYEEVEE